MADSIAQPTPTQNDVLESTRELVSEVARLDNLIDLHVEEFRRVRNQREDLLVAIKTVLAGHGMGQYAGCQCDGCSYARGVVSAVEAYR